MSSRLDNMSEIDINDITVDDLNNMDTDKPIKDMIQCPKCKCIFEEDEFEYTITDEVEQPVYYGFDNYGYETHKYDIEMVECPYCKYSAEKESNEFSAVFTDDLADVPNIDEYIPHFKDKINEESDMKMENKHEVTSLTEATIKALYDGLDDSEYTNDVDGIVEDVLVITDPEITTDEYLELIDKAQEIVEDTPEGNIPFYDEYIGQYAQICPVCGGTFVEDHILEKGTACPICLDTPESFVVIGKLQSDEDVANDNNVATEDELGLGVSEVDSENLFNTEEVNPEEEYVEDEEREKVIASKQLEVTGNRLAESKLTESAGVIKEALNTGVLPIIDVDLYSLLSSGMLDDLDIPEGEEAKLDEIIQDVAPSFIKETIQDVLPSVEIYATGVYHPKQYNFSGDELEFDLVVSENEYNALKDKVVNDAGFEDYLKSKYASRSGFISSMPDNITEFNSADGWKQMVQVIMYALKDVNFEQINDSYLDSFMEAVWQEFPRLDDEEELNEAKFKDKVKAIKKSLKKNDKRLSDETAQKSAENIAGSMIKNETTNKQLDKMEDELRNKERQALKDAGDSNPENLFGIAHRVTPEVWKELEKEGNILNCIGMIHSILAYSPESSWEIDTIMGDEYLAKYIKQLGEDKVKELVAQEIDEYKNNAVIDKDVYTDSEGVTYNSVTFKNESKSNDFSYIEDTMDFEQLRSQLNDDELQEINDGVKAYDYYEGEDFDNASDYADAIGTRECIVQWAEGLISTLELIDDMKSLRESCNKMVESNVMDKPVKVFCYNTIEEYPTRAEAIEFYKDAAYGSDGHEKERYMNILMDLQYTDNDLVYDDEYDYAEYVTKNNNLDLDKEQLVDEYMEYVDNEFKAGNEQALPFNEWLAQRK